MDVMKKDVLRFIGHERQKLFGGIFIFIRRVPLSNLVVLTFVTKPLRKCYFLRRRLKRYRLFLWRKLLFWWFLIFHCKLLAEFQCGIDVFAMDCYNSSSIILTFFTETSPLRALAPLPKRVWATMDQGYVKLSFQFQFALKLSNTSGSVNKILAFAKNICCVDIHKKIPVLQRTYWYFTSSFIHFTGRKICWLNAAMSGRVVLNQSRHCIRG